MKLDQRLRDQHFYTRSLLESNIDALMTTDPRGIITDVNKQMEALTGCTRDELIGAPFKNYFTDSSRAEAGINRVLNEGKVTNYELTARAPRRHAHGGVVQRDHFPRPRQATAGRVRRGARHDGAEAVRADPAAEERRARGREPHEVGIPRQHVTRAENSVERHHRILGGAQGRLVGTMADQQRAFIGDIFNSGKHLLSLINDILDLSKVEAGKMMLDLEPVEVSSLFANSLSIVREKAATRKILLSLVAAKELGSIKVDVRKVKQIVYNLLSNAVKFTVEGGTVTLRARGVARAEVGKASGPWSGAAFLWPTMNSGISRDKCHRQRHWNLP